MSALCHIARNLKFMSTVENDPTNLYYLGCNKYDILNYILEPYEILIHFYASMKPKMSLWSPICLYEVQHASIKSNIKTTYCTTYTEPPLTFFLNALNYSVCKECNLIAIAKKLCSSSHGKIQLKLLAGEAALKPTWLEKHSSCWNGKF